MVIVLFKVKGLDPLIWPKYTMFRAIIIDCLMFCDS